MRKKHKNHIQDMIKRTKKNQKKERKEEGQDQEIVALQVALLRVHHLNPQAPSENLKNPRKVRNIIEKMLMFWEK